VLVAEAVRGKTCHCLVRHSHLPIAAEWVSEGVSECSAECGAAAVAGRGRPQGERGAWVGK
jgi:hypothetical protein